MNELLVNYLKGLSKFNLNRLFNDKSSTLTIYRLLDDLNKQIISSLLFSSKLLDQSTLELLYKDADLVPLIELNIIDNSNGSITLNEQFKHSLKQILIGREIESLSNSITTTIEQLDTFATQQWELILHYMVGSYNSTPSKGVLFLLEKSNLIYTANKQHRISSKGFQFLLEDVQVQLWQLLLEYLSLSEIRQMDLVEVLSFLFVLGTLELGKDYSIESLTNTQQAMLSDLRDYGLVWQRKTSSKRFYPTRLATTLTSSAPPLLPTTESSSFTTSSDNKRFIILETNYRLYAYTSNPLQISILNLFVTLKARYPNLVIGVITRDSIRSALSNGITAEQIIGYLTSHAHTQMHRNNPLLPVTVSDQIRLWELEKNRLKADDGVLYAEFRSQPDYEILLNYAKSYDCVLWSNDIKRMFFVTLEGHQIVREFVRRRIPGNNNSSTSSQTPVSL
ncbi:transcription factor Tfb2 [Wallemia mellicola]|uniref:RNA polymerase II transcription factor B subunit 2 n=2 Tax=Wallemia mellicola TaxID=1708541 RepID=A0A4T0NJR2_9BASI|nr:transcription factor Tfb2 [Wallemia mellicola CBS 633.66]TIB68472.1 hypothetical protein E3Q24_03661 [Wallemia mellicola]EIM21527.1 transcription factor Tfb2 [Wallemia mellicola CBS 633.66]TIB71285.1 hypothetical protein E3Q23_03843 [Wallemia mellicola]TIB76443.1 transcription factor Tfb2 [Wallemia mellicola]TIB86631.1 transcription factor Tfb2 [Wallemia mellicola]|eukprot:XP_006958414.1 transcription factor Tfb2 [Wallemia mellicola CBS 633.66]